MIKNNQRIDTTNLIGSLQDITNEAAAEAATIPASWNQQSATVGGASKLLRLCKEAARLLDNIQKLGRVSEGTMGGPPYA
jgi:hypothetical protein